MSGGPEEGGKLAELASFVEEFLKDDGTVELDEYRSFFESLRSPRQASAYLSVLISRIILLETGQGETVCLTDYVTSVLYGSSDFDPDSAPLVSCWDPSQEDTFEKESMFLTVYFIALNYKIDLGFSPLIAVLIRLKRVYENPPRIPIVKKVIKLLCPDDHEKHHMLIDLVEQCSNVDVSPDFTTGALTVDDISPALISIHLRHLLHTGEDTSAILNKVLLFLKYPMLIVEHENTLLPLLHILRSFLSSASNVERSLISLTIEVIQQYCMWPHPYCDVVTELLHLLTVEEKNPGHAFRYQIIQENPELQLGYTPTGKERTVHVLLDKASANGEVIHEILTAETLPDVPLSQLHINLLMHMIRNNSDTDVWLLGLDCCSDDDVAKFYHRASGIISEAMLMSVAEAEEFRLENYRLLVEDILHCPTTTKRESVTMTDRKLIVRPPPLELDVLPISCETSELPSSFHSKFKYPHKTSADMLLHILKQYNSVEGSQEVRVAIVGNDQTMHNIVGSYICLKTNSGWDHMFKDLSVVFYFIPVDACHIADYLARGDAWYGRHVLCLLDCILRLYPGLNIRPDMSRKKTVVWDQSHANAVLEALEFAKSEDVGEDSSGVNVTPSFLLRSELQTFIREARYDTVMNIYQCECWSPDGSYFTLPFLSRCELGVSAAARHFQIMRRLQDLSIRDIIATNKDFKSFYSPSVLDIKYAETNLAGVSRQGNATPSRQYSTFVVANIPIVSDKGVPADPSKSWLEVFATEPQRKKRQREYFYHASMIEVAPAVGRKKPFAMLLDGVLYSPFVKIRISPCVSAHDELQAVSFRTYLPFSG